MWSVDATLDHKSIPFPHGKLKYHQTKFPSKNSEFDTI